VSHTTGALHICPINAFNYYSVGVDDMLPSPSRATVVAAPETPPSQSHSAKGRNAKAKAPPRNSGASENMRALKATPRRVSGAMSSDTSDDEASDNDLVAQGSFGNYLHTHTVPYRATDSSLLV
jgi:hypothetical protein